MKCNEGTLQRIYLWMAYGEGENEAGFRGATVRGVLRLRSCVLGFQCHLSKNQHSYLYSLGRMFGWFGPVQVRRCTRCSYSWFGNISFNLRFGLNN